jgi:hypothetical protein
MSKTKGFYILFSIVTSKWCLPVGVHWDSKQTHEQLRDDSDSFSEFNQDSDIDMFYGIDPDAEICGPDLDESCSNSCDGQASANVDGDNGANDDSGGGGDGYNVILKMGLFGKKMTMTFIRYHFMPHLVIYHLKTDKYLFSHTNFLCYFIAFFLINSC